MKHYKDTSGAVYAFEADGSQDAFIPEGLIAISDAEANRLRNPPESHADAQARALTLLRAERAPILSVLDGMQCSALVSGDTAKAQTIETLKQGLKNAPDAIPWDSCPDFETMRKAGKAYYASLVNGVPSDILSAFWVSA